jgi:hypothetical protein
MRAFESRIVFSFAGTAAQVLQPASLDHQLSSAECAVPGFRMVLMSVLTSRFILDGAMMHNLQR